MLTKPNNLYNLADHLLERIHLFDRILNSLTNLIVEFKHGWTETQRRVIKLYKELQNQEKVAETLGVTQQNIAKILKNTNWKKIQEAEETINSILRDTNRYNLKML